MNNGIKTVIGSWGSYNACNERKGITPITDFMLLNAYDYPIFDDLAALISEKIKTADDYNKAYAKHFYRVTPINQSDTSCLSQLPPHG